MNQPLYPLALDRLQWAERTELIKSMREARGIEAFAARFIGCSARKVRDCICKFQIEPGEYGGDPFPEQKKPDECLDAALRAQILKVLNETGWNKTRTAQRIGIARPTLYTRMEKLQISLNA